MGVCVICALFLGARGHDDESAKKTKRGGYILQAGKNKTEIGIWENKTDGSMAGYVQCNETLM